MYGDFRMFLEDTMPEMPNFLSKDGYRFHYFKGILEDFNKELYTKDTGLSDSLIENNPELEEVLEYFAEKCTILDIDEDLIEKDIDILDLFLNQVRDF